MKYKRILKLQLLLLFSALTCHAQTTMTLTDNGDGTWTLKKMPSYDMKMVVEYEDIPIVVPPTCVFADNGDGSWTLDKMPSYDMKMVVEYEDVDIPVPTTCVLVDNGDGTWSLDKMPPYNMKMVVEYENDQFDIAANSDGKGNYWATYYNDKAGYSADANTMVYTATMSADKRKVILKEVDDRVVPAGNAVILKSADASVTMTYAESATGTFAENELKGSATAVTTPENTYMLVKGANGVGFYHWKEADIPSGKAYLIIDHGAALAREFFPFAEETATVINVVSAEEDDNDGVYYDLTGRMVVGKPSVSGIYVRNGKKVVIK